MVGRHDLRSSCIGFSRSIIVLYKYVEPKRLIFKKHILSLLREAFLFLESQENIATFVNPMAMMSALNRIVPNADDVYNAEYADVEVYKTGQ